MSKAEPYDLKQSLDWIKKKFAKQQFKEALSYVDRCLNEIAGYEYSFLMSKTSTLFCLEKWEELTSLFNYLYERYPNDAEVLYNLGEFFLGQGEWNSALTLLNKSESLLDPKEHAHFMEGLVESRISSLMALDRKSEAIRSAETVLKKYPRFSVIRSDLRQLRANKYRLPEPWIPRDFSQSLSKPILDLKKTRSTNEKG